MANLKLTRTSTGLVEPMNKPIGLSQTRFIAPVLCVVGSAQCEAPVTHCNLSQSEAFTSTTAATMASRKANFEES